MGNRNRQSTALDRLYDWYTISGDEVRDELEPYYEPYRLRFFETLESCQLDDPHIFEESAVKAEGFDELGDFLDEGSDQYGLIAAFGFVLFDRINSRWDSLGKADLFFLHEQLAECAEICFRKIGKSEEARARATKGHSRRQSAKKFVFDEWGAHRTAYEFNKSAFARDYVRRVINEFNVRVTEKQLREVWLKEHVPDADEDVVVDGQSYLPQTRRPTSKAETDGHTPSAGKPAGLPASGE